jgi:hypothetical protein
MKLRAMDVRFRDDSIPKLKSEDVSVQLRGNAMVQVMEDLRFWQDAGEAQSSGLQSRRYGPGE